MRNTFFVDVVGTVVRTPLTTVAPSASTAFARAVAQPRFHTTAQCYRLVSPGVALRTRKTSALNPSDDVSGHLTVSPPV